MPAYIGGKSNFDVDMNRAYNFLVTKAGVSKVKVKNEVTTTHDRDNRNDEYDSLFYEGNILDKARFVNVKTYCDTDGTLLIMPQEMNDIYALLAVQMVRRLPKFIPAQFNEEPVPVYLTIPVRFLKEIKYTPTKAGKRGGAIKGEHRCFLRRWFWALFHPFRGSL